MLSERAKPLTETEACLWLGKRVSLIGRGGRAASTGLLRHVSSRNAFVLERACTGADSGCVRLVPLAAVVRIVPAPEDPSAAG
jgi:hypothetical protein